MSPRLGVVLVPSLPPEALRPLAVAADEHLDDLWLWEDCFKESAMAAAGAALAWTERVRVGVGLVPVPLRTVPLLAMELATLHRMFPGRLAPGVGHGVQGWMGQVGVRPRSPMTLLDESVTALRALLDGEEVSTSGEYVRLDRVRLDWPPSPGTPLLVGGSGPRTLRFAGRRGDGVLLASALSEAEVAEQVGWAREGWAEAGHEGSPPVTTNLVVATGPDAHERVRRDLARWGVDDGAPGRAAAGGAEEVADTLGRLADLGVTEVAVQPAADEPDVDGLVRFVGTDVRAALGG
ncbi:LLM class flavin-dependent oxidoreductase [Phycicoccus sp. BSK3Z-2]|uniref:LLM class flavin-dependent oxidoreductase n=1 Tax=Phycicoccus avicenniae TaxID=2828860 RepID=A0A941I1K4_9MICO|nr:LLM class flavin-dependent oxidoreductase [Phycicoccus avicenniae]MBR7744154.1 LLM class flavin-dependent oxidoreductase [Phycicoccus avicenniae]